MKRVFEDEYMDLHAEIISLCLDALEEEQGVDVVYAYCSIEGAIYTFNAFFTRKGKAYTLDDINLPFDALSDILGEGAQIGIEIGALCKEFGRPVPTEIKMIYEVGQESLAVDYKYEPQETESRFVHDIFLDWVKAIDPNYGIRT